MMADTNPPTSTDLKAGLIEALRASRDAERDVFGAVAPADRETPAPDGGWSAKDVQSHLSAWKRTQIGRLEAIREGRDEPEIQLETDEINAIYQAERADRTWDEVVADADATTDDLIAAIERASDETIAVDRVSGSIMGNGSEHALTHLPPIAASVGATARVFELAGAIEGILASYEWPERPITYAQYNLACFYSLAGELDRARVLLRQCLPLREELRTFAAEDTDLAPLRDEITALSAG